MVMLFLENIHTINPEMNHVIHSIAPAGRSVLNMS